VRGERALASSYRWAAIGWWLLGLAASLGVSVLLHPAGLDDRDAALARGLIAATGYLTASGMGWLWMAHNSLVELRQRVLQAWANIDVQLKRRADLIPGLVRIVEAAGAHERETLEAVTLLRSQRVATRPGRAGPDPRACGALLAGLDERYPTLRADAAFRSLASALSDSEERIALARAYVNDIATHLNTRLETVPDNLVAALTGIRRQELMQAEGFARDAPRVRM
jgi:LemA protein